MFKKITTFILLSVFFFAIAFSIEGLCARPLINPIILNSEQAIAVSLNSTDFPFFKKNNKKVDTEKLLPSEKVYLGGIPLGFTMNSKGVIIVGISSVSTSGGEVDTTKGSNIKIGDIITHINNVEVNNAEKITEVVNSIKEDNLRANCIVIRNNKKHETTITPAKDSITSSYKLGLWIRDNAAGVGTLTFIRENGDFGALGHPVCDIDTGTIMPVSEGSAFKCNIVGIQKGVKGRAGELKGMFLRNSNEIGSINKNCEYGIYGKINDEFIKSSNMKMIEVGNRNTVKAGKAQIFCTLEGREGNYYDIEIIKVNTQSSHNKRSMVIKITDKTLLEKSGGIVQGMSGSPIIQNNKVVGAVTHVFVGDPSKGFGIYIDWMLA
ncbi:MAG: SpoIVB peptidase [Clostridia bacterium]